MKKTILICLTFLLSISSVKATNWMTSYEDAQKLAIATNKLILIDFWATWCRPCLMMDSDTWSKQEVKDLMNNFVPLKIDIDSNRSIASKYSANRIPYVVIIDPTGEIIFDEAGYKDKNKMIRILEKYSVNMQGFQDDFLKYRKEQTSDVAMKIAEKYFDYSIYVDKSVRKDFLGLGNSYLKKAKKLANKKEYKSKCEQRADLLSDVYNKVIRGKYEKALAVLNDDFTEENIQEENKGLFNFLYFVAYNKLEDKEKARAWYDKLKTDKNAKLYLLKSRKL